MIYKYLAEAELKSHLDKNFKNNTKISLSSLKRLELDKQFIDENKKDYKFLSHLRTGNSTTNIAWIKNNKIIAILSIEDKNDDIWITAIEIVKEYQGSGLSKQILDVATKEYGATALSVNKSNELAIYIYNSYGFKSDNKDHGQMLFMYKK